MLEAMARFMTLRNDLFDLIGKLLAVDGHCKSYEGAFTLHMPNYFQENSDDGNDWRIHLDCYLIGPGRHYDWCGETLTGVVGKCERDVRVWMGEMRAQLEAGEY